VWVAYEAETGKNNISSLVLTARVVVEKKGGERVGSVRKVRATKHCSLYFFEVLHLHFRCRDKPALTVVVTVTAGVP
jgi:hypothetical protein